VPLLQNSTKTKKKTKSQNDGFSTALKQSCYKFDGNLTELFFPSPAPREHSFSGGCAAVNVNDFQKSDVEKTNGMRYIIPLSKNSRQAGKSSKYFL
jgi:hypothetical protein